MRARFVILHHQLHDGQHWDLMLEHGEVLLTWQLLGEPVDRSRLPIPARRIKDHRKLYLDYEGPIIGDRGFVRRVDAGELEIEHLSAMMCRFVARGRRLTGRFVLVRIDHEWQLAASEP